MADITLSVTTSLGEFAVTTTTDDSVVQEMLDSLRARYNVSASSPQDVLRLIANTWLAEINKMVTDQRVANVEPLHLSF